MSATFDTSVTIDNCGCDSVMRDDRINVEHFLSHLNPHNWGIIVHQLTVTDKDSPQVVLIGN